MQKALIGYTGFVGGNLCAQTVFSHLYNSGNIETIHGGHFDELVCSGMPAAKWIANKNPEQDRATLDRLIAQLRHVTTKSFTLISTVDVYHQPNGVDEAEPPDLAKSHPYGLHRAMLEDFVREHFPHHLIARLPGLFGPGLKKNVIYDLIHRNQVENIHPDSAYQYYDLKHLTADLAIAREAGLGLIHLTSEPVATRTIAERFFPEVALTEKQVPAAGYDFRTRHARLWNASGFYQYSAEKVLGDLGQFLGASQR